MSFTCAVPRSLHKQFKTYCAADVPALVNYERFRAVFGLPSLQHLGDITYRFLYTNPISGAAKQRQLTG